MTATIEMNQHPTTRHLLTLGDVDNDELGELLDLATSLKEKFNEGVREPILRGRVLGLLFSKPSLRTRVSFEAAMAHLGGTSLYLGQDVGWGKREPVNDFGRVLSQYTDAIVCRTFAHSSIEELARYCDCPVINGLTDQAHPCQALADVMTVQEEVGTLNGRVLVFVGDGNNVARSLALACKRLGVVFRLSAPAGYEFPTEFLQVVSAMSGEGSVELQPDPQTAVTDASVIYTDVWSSMGRRKSRSNGKRILRTIKLTLNCWATHGKTPYSCTACLPSEGRK